jgi:hypothetical protein
MDKNLSSELIKKRIKNIRRKGDCLNPAATIDTMEIYNVFNAQYNKENEEKRKFLKEQKVIIKNYFNTLSSDEEIKKKIKALSTKHKIMQI